MGFVVSLAAIALALAFHEFSHAYVANRMGDTTAAEAGRLTLNPLAHLDLVGTLCLVLVGFGWGKPVPVNEDNLRNRRWGGLLVSLAGPVSNIVLTGLVIGVSWLFLYSFAGYWTVVFLFKLAGISLVLAVFNLLPIPPLDGSRVLFDLLPYRYRSVQIWLAKNGLMIMLGLLILLNFSSFDPFRGLWVLTARLMGVQLG